MLHSITQAGCLHYLLKTVKVTSVGHRQSEKQNYQNSTTLVSVQHSALSDMYTKEHQTTVQVKVLYFQ